MRPLLIGNWKLNKTIGQARQFAAQYRAQPRPRSVEVVIAPPVTALAAVAQEGVADCFALAAQSCGPSLAGARTGDLSAALLRDAGAQYALLGHSEARTHLGETEERIAGARQACLEAGLTPVVCIGESQAARTHDGGRESLTSQLVWADSVAPAADGPPLLVAYEPVWSIGQAKAASPAVIGETLAWLAATLAERLGPGVQAHLLYGGGVQPADVEALMALPHVGGLLVGSASLSAETLARIAVAMAGVDASPSQRGSS